MLRLDRVDMHFRAFSFHFYSPRYLSSVISLLLHFNLFMTSEFALSAYGVHQFDNKRNSHTCRFCNNHHHTFPERIAISVTHANHCNSMHVWSIYTQIIRQFVCTKPIASHTTKGLINFIHLHAFCVASSLVLCHRCQRLLFATSIHMCI